MRSLVALIALSALALAGLALVGCAELGVAGRSVAGPADEARLGDLAVSGQWMAAASVAKPTNQQADKPAMKPAMVTSAAYLVIRNRGKAPDRLLSAASDVADAVEIHTVEKRGDVMAMRPVDGIDLPAGSEVRLEPGGYHIMLIGLRRDLTEGGTARLTLRFQNAGDLTVVVAIRAR